MLEDFLDWKLLLVKRLGIEALQYFTQDGVADCSHQRWSVSTNDRAALSNLPELWVVLYLIGSFLSNGSCQITNKMSQQSVSVKQVYHHCQDGWWLQSQFARVPSSPCDQVGILGLHWLELSLLSVVWRFCIFCQVCLIVLQAPDRICQQLGPRYHWAARSPILPGPQWGDDCLSSPSRGGLLEWCWGLAHGSLRAVERKHLDSQPQGTVHTSVYN